MAFKESAPEKSYKLKERLEELYDAALTESELMNLAKAMLEEIGSADPYLRDHLIYTSFARLIGEGSFSHIMLKKSLPSARMTVIYFTISGQREMTACLPAVFLPWCWHWLFKKMQQRDFFPIKQFIIHMEKHWNI